MTDDKGVLKEHVAQQRLEKRAYQGIGLVPVWGEEARRRPSPYLNVFEKHGKKNFPPWNHTWKDD